MKKILLVLLSVGILFTVTACGEKTNVLSPEDFEKKLTDAGYTIKDETAVFGKGQGVTKLLVAESEGNMFQINYLKLETEDLAKTEFKDLVKRTAEYKTEESKEVKNYTDKINEYSLETSEKYFVITITKDTIIYTEVGIDYKEMALEGLEKIN